MSRHDEEDTFVIEDAHATRANDKAIFVRAPDFGDKGEWIPKSQVHDDSEVYDQGHEGKLVITAWLARQRGWL